MGWKLLRRAENAISSKRENLGLQIILWVLWTLTVVATAYLNWHGDIVAQRSTNLIGLIIHTALVGIIGLVVMTVVEMHLEPWRFLDEQ